MSELSVDVLVTNVLNGMMDSLDDEQLKKLKDQLYIQLRDVDITNKSYDLVELMQENDTYTLKMFVASERVRKLSEKSIAQYINAVVKLRTFIGKNFIDINTTEIECYLATKNSENNWKTNTLSNNIHYLSAFFKYLKSKKLITENPMDSIEPVRQEKVIREKFTAAEKEMLRLACRDNIRDITMVEFLLATALRVSELANLRWHDIDFSHLEVTVKHGKGAKDRIVPFTEKCGFYLLRYMDWRMENEKRTKEEILDRPVFVTMRRNPKTKDYEGMGNSGIEDILRRVGRKAHITTKNNPHKYRRTMATDAINKGMDIEVLMKIMGHEEYDTTLSYAEVKTPKVMQQYRMICE